MSSSSDDSLSQTTEDFDPDYVEPRGRNYIPRRRRINCEEYMIVAKEQYTKRMSDASIVEKHGLLFSQYQKKGSEFRARQFGLTSVHFDGGVAMYSSHALPTLRSLIDELPANRSYILRQGGDAKSNVVHRGVYDGKVFTFFIHIAALDKPQSSLCSIPLFFLYGSDKSSSLLPLYSVTAPILTQISKSLPGLIASLPGNRRSSPMYSVGDFPFCNSLFVSPTSAGKMTSLSMNRMLPTMGQLTYAWHTSPTCFVCAAPPCQIYDMPAASWFRLNEPTPSSLLRAAPGFSRERVVYDAVHGLRNLGSAILADLCLYYKNVDPDSPIARELTKTLQSLFPLSTGWNPLRIAVAEAQAKSHKPLHGVDPAPFLKYCRSKSVDLWKDLCRETTVVYNFHQKPIYASDLIPLFLSFLNGCFTSNADAVDRAGYYLSLIYYRILPIVSPPREQTDASLMFDPTKAAFGPAAHLTLAHTGYFIRTLQCVPNSSEYMKQHAGIWLENSMNFVAEVAETYGTQHRLKIRRFDRVPERVCEAAYYRFTGAYENLEFHEAKKQCNQSYHYISLSDPIPLPDSMRKRILSIVV